MLEDPDAPCHHPLDGFVIAGAERASDLVCGIPSQCAEQAAVQCDLHLRPVELYLERLGFSSHP